MQTSSPFVVSVAFTHAAAVYRRPATELWIVSGESSIAKSPPGDSARTRTTCSPSGASAARSEAMVAVETSHPAVSLSKDGFVVRLPAGMGLSPPSPPPPSPPPTISTRTTARAMTASAAPAAITRRGPWRAGGATRRASGATAGGGAARRASGGAARRASGGAAGAGLLGQPYSPTKMSYDLRRLRLHGLIARLPHSNTYVLTPEGIRVAVFYSKLQNRLLRPLLEADKPPAPIPVRRALATLEHAVNDYVHNARLAA